MIVMAVMAKPATRRRSGPRVSKSAQPGRGASGDEFRDVYGQSLRAKLKLAKND